MTPVQTVPTSFLLSAMLRGRFPEVVRCALHFKGIPELYSCCGRLFLCCKHQACDSISPTTQVAPLRRVHELLFEFSAVSVVYIDAILQTQWSPCDLNRACQFAISNLVKGLIYKQKIKINVKWNKFMKHPPQWTPVRKSEHQRGRKYASSPTHR